MNEIRTDEHLETDLRLESRLAKQKFDAEAYGAGDSLNRIAAEVERAKRHGELFASLHEAYAVILEELDELWEEVKKKACNREHEKMYKEAVQIAAMGMRFAVDICLDDQGRIR